MGISEAISQVEKLLGDRLSRNAAVREQHAKGEAHIPGATPDAVAFPETTAEVSEIARICNVEGCPIVAWGAGTSLEGHLSAIRGGISLDFQRMKKVLEVHPGDLDVVVQPGITRKELNSELRDTGLFFPVDPGADATIGGMAATRASGTCAVRYGTMREAVLALEVVLADGRVIRTGTRARKSASGYDLTRLFVGSEGTLGIITEITLRLAGVPEAQAAATCAFPELEGAVNTVMETMQIGLPMARIELVDEAQIHASNIHSGLGLPEVPHLFVEFHGTERGVEEQVALFGEIASGNGGKDFAWAREQEDRNRLWSVRHDAYWAARTAWPGHESYITDICVPISRLAEVVLSAKDAMAEKGFTGPLVGHAGDGNFHLQIMLPPDDPTAEDRASKLASTLVDQALAAGGTATGEHGIGLGKMKHMASEHGDAWAVMATIKKSLDPGNILNPGKVVVVN